MIDKLSQALTLVGEAFEDARTGTVNLADLDLAGQVDAAQKVINAATAVQVLRVAQYAARDEEQDPAGVWVDVQHDLGHVNEFASDCFGPALAMGPACADRLVNTAAVLASRPPWPRWPPETWTVGGPRSSPPSWPKPAGSPARRSRR